MRQNSIEARYAKALFSAASKKGNTREVNTLLQNITKALLKTLGGETKPLVTNVLKKPETPISINEEAYLIFERFLRLVSESGRANSLPKIANIFQAILEQKNGSFLVTISMARNPSSEEREHLQSIAKKILPQGTAPLLSFSVNPEIIGGLIIELGGITVDLSAAPKVAQIQAAIAGE